MLSTLVSINMVGHSIRSLGMTIANNQRYPRRGLEFTMISICNAFFKILNYPHVMMMKLSALYQILGISFPTARIGDFELKMKLKGNHIDYSQGLSKI
jgi:hypothetical protein